MLFSWLYVVDENQMYFNKIKTFHTTYRVHPTYPVSFST